jgi:predicted transcriptional regulator
MKYWKNKMTPEEITIQEMEKAIDIFKKEYRDNRNSLSSIFAKDCERVTLQEIAKKYDCWWKTLHKIANEEQVSMKTLKKICVKILEKQNEQTRKD